MATPGSSSGCSTRRSSFRSISCNPKSSRSKCPSGKSRRKQGHQIRIVLTELENHKPFVRGGGDETTRRTLPEGVADELRMDCSGYSVDLWLVVTASFGCGKPGERRQNCSGLCALVVIERDIRKRDDAILSDQIARLHGNDPSTRSSQRYQVRAYWSSIRSASLTLHLRPNCSAMRPSVSSIIGKLIFTVCRSLVRTS